MYDIAINLAAHIADISIYESSLPHTSESSDVTLFDFSLNDMIFENLQLRYISQLLQ